MRILVVNYEFPPVGGGGGRIAEDLCRALARRGHELRVLTSWIAPLQKVEARDGYTILRSFAFRGRQDRCSIPEMGGYVLAHLWPCRKQLHDWKPDLLHVHFAVPSGVVACAATRLVRTPYVLTAHLGDVPGGVPDQTDRAFRWIKPLTNPIWRQASAITACSEFTRSLALRAYDVPIETIPNAVDVNACIPSPARPHSPLRFLFVGRFNAQKNLRFLATVLARIKDLPWEMHFIGDGSLRPAIESEVERLELRARVRFHGWVREDEVARVMSESDVLLLPSLSEGLSLVGINSLAHGLAIVASRIAGNLDLVRDGQNGMLCEVNDHEAFDQALRKLLTSAELVAEMKTASRELARRFDLNTVTDQYERVFQRVTG